MNQKEEVKSGEEKDLKVKDVNNDGVDVEKEK